MNSSNNRILTVDQVSEAVNNCLQQFFADRRAEVERIDPYVADAVSMLEDMVLGGGKRLRPVFAWVGFVGAGGLDTPDRENPDSVLRAISALELIQACALIHDDIIDASDTRRGSPTVHRRVEARHTTNKWNGSSSHFGEAVAILVGDLALAWAEEMMQTSGLSLKALRRVQLPWSKMKTEVIAGQLLDITVESAGDETTEVAEKINRFKTAAYTVERPLHIGAAIANADAEIIDAYRGYGTDIGIAFQLRDDTLGVFGDPAVTGKPAGDDLREGKRTVLLAEALRRADSTDAAAAEQLRSKVGNTEDPDELLELASIIRRMGAEASVEKRVAQLTESGLSYLDIPQLPEEAREELRKLAERATKRQV